MSSVLKCVSQVNCSELMWTKMIRVERLKVKFKLDTGAEVNIVPLKLIRSLTKEKDIRKTNVILIAYGNRDFKIRPIGEINLNCYLNDQCIALNFMIVDTKDQMTLLGLNGCVKLNLAARINSVDKKLNTVQDLVQFYPAA